MAWVVLYKTDKEGGGSRVLARASETVPTSDPAQGESNCCTPFPQIHTQMASPKAMKAGVVLKRACPRTPQCFFPFSALLLLKDNLFLLPFLLGKSLRPSSLTSE